jgi:hypothetical protein
MKSFSFCVSYKNHKFQVCTDRHSSLCFYSRKDNYTTSLTFASNTYARVEYKNLRFSGRVTTRNVWSVKADYTSVVRKHKHCYYFGPQTPIPIACQDTATEDIVTSYPENVLYLYDLLIHAFPSQYSEIENKEAFKQQLCEDLLRRYADVDANSLDKVVKYENYTEVGPEDAPIIELRTIRNILLYEYEECFTAFHQSESDSKNIAAVFSPENLISAVPKLREIPLALLQENLASYLDENRTELIRHDMNYSRSSELFFAGSDLCDACACAGFVNSAEERISKLLSARGFNDVDKSDLLAHIHSTYSEDYIPTDEEFEESVIDFANKYTPFYRLYNKFTSLFHTNHIELEWNDETIQLFQEYEKNEHLIDPKCLAEFEAYKYISLFYRKHFFKKNSTQRKQIIEQLPSFTAFAASVFEILFKHNILIDEPECVVYNKDGDVDSAFEELRALSTL